MDKKGNIYSIMLGIIILLVGILGVAFWGIGYIFDKPNAIWLGRIFLSVLTLGVLVIERFIK